MMSKRIDNYTWCKHYKYTRNREIHLKNFSVTKGKRITFFVSKLFGLMKIDPKISYLKLINVTYSFWSKLSQLE